jgi:hypothetical protein
MQGVNLDFLLGFLGYNLGARLQPLYSAENVVVVVARAGAAGQVQCQGTKVQVVIVVDGKD